MNVLAFNHDSGLYGAQRSLLSLLLGLQEKGHEILLCMPTQGLAFNEAWDQGIRTEVVTYPRPMGGIKNLLKFIVESAESSKQIQQMTKDFKPNAVIYNTVACLAPAIALRKSGYRKIWSIREMSPMLKIMSRVIYNLSDISVANCSYVSDQYNYLQKRHHMTTVFNGISIKQNLNTDYRNTHEQKERPIVFFLGYLGKHKDPMTLLNATKTLLDKKIYFDLFIFGDGCLKTTIELFIEQHKLSEHVHLMGFQKNMIDHMAVADIIVIPSAVEPFPRVGLEAMALSKPIIGSRVGGICLQVEENLTGYLFSSGNAPELAEKMGKLIQCQELRERFGKAGKVKQEREFSEEAYISNYEKIIFGLKD
ncbi:MAG: hypothetical protein DRH08_03785 [Deltaproteobacteria bacterium]|nr:MAG: hypothetical protein DRH08_03785 [Deltaproteobacteria bacterium]